jgi:hypothetical protein
MKAEEVLSPDEQAFVHAMSMNYSYAQLRQNMLMAALDTTTPVKHVVMLSLAAKAKLGREVEVK